MAEKSFQVVNVDTGEVKTIKVESKDYNEPLKIKIIRE